MTHVLNIVKWNGVYYSKNVITALKKIDLKCRGFSLVHHDSQKIKKVVNFIGPVVTRY